MLGRLSCECRRECEKTLARETYCVLKVSDSHDSKHGDYSVWLKLSYVSEIHFAFSMFLGCVHVFLLRGYMVEYLRSFGIALTKVTRKCAWKA
jgi:hypothetical protein